MESLLKRLKRFLFGSSPSSKRPRKKSRPSKKKVQAAGRKVRRVPGRSSKAVRKKAVKKAAKKKTPAKKGIKKKTGTKKRVIKKPVPSAKKKTVQKKTAVLKKAARRPATKKAVRSAKKPTVPAKEKLPGVLAGKITHYFDRVHAAVVKVERREIRNGDRIVIQGPKTRVRMTIRSLQINRIPVDSGRVGEEVGVEVKQRVREGDQVFLVD